MGWRALQITIIVVIVYVYKAHILKPDERVNLGHLVLFGFGVAFVITWLISRAIDLVRTNSATCFSMALLVTAAAIVGWIDWLAAEGRTLDAPGFAIMGAIGFCIFVPLMWVASKSILLVGRLQGHPPPPRPARQPVTLAALVARWRTPLSYCIFWLLWTPAVILTLDSQDIYPWDDKIGTFLNIGRGTPLVISWMVTLIAAGLATRFIIRRLLRGGGDSDEASNVRSDVRPVPARLPKAIDPGPRA